jgi:hypothetical protein
MKLTAVVATMGFGMATARGSIEQSEQRARELVAQMTPEEKYGILQGYGWTNYDPDRGVFIGNTKPGALNEHPPPFSILSLVTQASLSVPSSCPHFFSLQ